MLTSFEEWKTKKLDELQVGDQNPTNYRKIGQGLGDPTEVANPRYMSYLKPRIEGLWRLNLYKAEKDNPGSTADPGRMRVLKDKFIRDILTVVTKLVLGDEAGGGRNVNYNRGSLNNTMTQHPDISPTPQQPGYNMDKMASGLSAQAMGQGPQLR